MSKKLYLFGKGARIKLVIFWLIVLFVLFQCGRHTEKKVPSWSECVMNTRRQKSSVPNLKKQWRGAKGRFCAPSTPNEFHAPPEHGKAHSMQMKLSCFCFPWCYGLTKFQSHHFTHHYHYLPVPRSSNTLISSGSCFIVFHLRWLLNTKSKYKQQNEEFVGNPALPEKA